MKERWKVTESFLKKFVYSVFKGFALWRKAGSHAAVIKALRSRIMFSGACCIIVFLVILYRLADVMIISRYGQIPPKIFSQEEIIQKVDIVDRNGELLATSLITASCYADPSVVIDIEETANKLSKIQEMPSAEKIKQKLSDKNKHFVWIMRHVTPEIQEKVMDLGLPGIKFQKDYKRIYIHGNLFSHTIGYTDIDGTGICGLERQFSDELKQHGLSGKRLVTTLDLRLQSIVYEELSSAIKKYSAQGGNGILMKSNGELLAIVSLPDYNPNDLKHVNIENMFNRNTLGVFEQGSILKILNVAIALDSGYAQPGSIFDATEPIRIGRFKITDFKGKHRPLTLTEAFVYSSNIASAKMAQMFGAKIQQEYMRKLGMLGIPEVEIPERGHAIVPTYWNDTTCMTVSYGYGLASTPLQTLTAVTSIVNDGIRVHPTLIQRASQHNSMEERIVSRETSILVREMMRAVVCYGTGKKADIPGISIIGKTGTAYKLKGRGYGSDGNRQRITTFIGGFPKDKPQYMLLVSLDDPKATSETCGYATAGWNIAPTAHKIFERIIPILNDGTIQKESTLKIVKYLKLDK